MNNFNNDCCKHKIGVQIHSWDSSYKWNEVYCLNCDENFNGPNIMFDKSFYDLLPFENIINFEKLNDVEDIQKVALANNLLKQLKIKYSNLSDSKIVDIINSYQIIEYSKNNQKIKYYNL